jgi:hypothetical protein
MRAQEGARNVIIEAVENFDNVFEGPASISVQVTEYHKVPGSSDTRTKYDEI